MVIEPGNVRVVAGVGGRSKAKTQCVRAIAGDLVGGWVLLEDAQDRLIYADSLRIYSFYLVEIEPIIAGLNRVGFSVRTEDIAPGTVRCVQAAVRIALT